MMANLDLPHISSSSATASQYNLAAQGLAFGNQFVGDLARQNDPFRDQVLRQARQISLDAAGRGQLLTRPQATIPTVEEPVMSRRLVQVYIVDPDENVSVDQAMLYKGAKQFTDLTDQELFFEIDIKSILNQHNEKRVKLINKKVKERTEHLEPAKIRDLKMVVVTIAQF